MKATVIATEPRIQVRIRRGAVQTVDTYKNEHLYDVLKVGDVVDVYRVTNSPYVYVDGHNAKRIYR